MAEVISLGERRMDRMTTSEQFEHIERLINRLDHYTIKSAEGMLETLKLRHKTVDSTSGICLHLIYVGFLSGDEGANYTGDELLNMVENNLPRYEMCLYRTLKEKFPDNIEVNKMNPLKTV